MRSWILALIFLLYGSSMAKGTDPPKATVNAKPITLNISNVDLIALEKHNYKLHNLETPIYTAKNGYYIEKIVEDNVEICKDLPKGAFVKVTHCHRKKWFDILHVYIVESDDKKDVKYFLKKDNKWSPIKEEEFYDHFNALSHTEHSFKKKVFSLTGNKNEWELYVNVSPKSQFAVYGVKSTCRVVKIVTTRYRGSTIWKRKKDEWCTKITLYPKKDYKLMWIVTKDPYENEEILYYSKSSGWFGSWKEVTKEEYMGKLTESGFNKDEFNDKVTLDISKYDKDLFFEDKYNVDIVTMARYHVLPGFRIKKVVDGNSLIWESTDDKFATYFRLNTRGSKVSLGALFTTNTRKEHKIIYYAKNASGSWKVIDKSLYYDILAGRGSPVYTREAPKPKITMSSFKNKKGLRLISYVSRIDNAKADIILSNSTRGSFLTDFGTFDMDWSYECYGFDVFPHISIFDKPVDDVKKVSNSDRYRQYFEHKTLEGMNPYDILHRSQYEGTFLEALNRLGYNVYGYDNQSHGFSEAETEKRCHVEDFKDYVHDLLQFVNIIRRGKFEDYSQVYDEQTVLKSVDCSRKTILLGFSMGGNAAIQAIQEFYKKVKTPQAKFVDALIGLSTMLDIDHFMASFWRKVARPILKLDAYCQPKKDAYFQTPYDNGIIFERFSDYHTDMLYYNRIYTRKTVMFVYLACRNARGEKKTKFIPSDLPILLVHTANDSVCDVKGPHTFISRLEDSKVARLLEFKGDGHHFMATQLVPLLVPQISSWLDERFYGGVKYLPPKPLKVSLATRVDSSIFDVQEGMEKGVPVLRLKVKSGKATKLVYMGKEVWSGSSCSSCCVSAGCASSLSSATLYFNGTVLELVKVTVGETDKLLHRTKTTWYECGDFKWAENGTEFGKRLKWLEEASKYAEVPVQKVTQPVPKSPHNDKHVAHNMRREPEHEPKSHVKVPQNAPSPIPTIKDAILDITDVDLKLFTMSESFIDGMLVKKTFTPNDGHRLMEVLDMNLPIWTSGGQNEHAKSVVVHYSKNGSHLLSITINDGHSTKPKCFEKVGSSWNEIKDREFNEKLKKDPIVLLAPGSKPTKAPSPGQTRVVLDISSPNSSSIDTFTRLPYEMVQTIYTARDGYRITSVTEFGREIWKAKDGHSCTHVNVLTHGDKRTHVNIYVRDKEGTMNVLYYAKDDEEWNTIEEDAFYRRFHIEAIKRSIIETIALDIKGKNDASKLYVNDSSTFQFTAYAPNVGYRISAIKEGSTKIWEVDSEDQGCLYTSLYPKTTPTLAYLVIHTSEDLKELYYSKNGTTWTTMNREEYLKKLAEAGFNESTFDNTIILDISNVNKDSFRIKELQVGNYAAHLYTPSVGLQLKSIVDNGQETLWKAEEGEHCTYLNLLFKDEKPFSFYILVDNSDGNRKIIYYAKLDGSWTPIQKSLYFGLLSDIYGMALDKMDGQKITMSSFRNRQGLKITGYSSTVNSSKGDIILVHGLRSHFMSEFSTSSMEWNFEHFGSPPFLNINGLFLNESKHKRNLVEMYRHLFEHASLDGKDASLVQPGYEYEGSLIEFFNKLGYNVYGYDLQSHGLSEAQTELNCHVNDFKDYLNDLIQFVSIVKRGKFSDPNETYDEQSIFKSIPSSRKLFLHGHSMGGNVVMQAIQEFYRMANNPSAHFVDGIILTSPMFCLDNYLSKWYGAAQRSVLNAHAWHSPMAYNSYETPFDYGESFDIFLRHRDPSFYANKLTFKTAKSMLDACDDVKKEDHMAHYPRNLPTIFIHTKDDDICDVKGPRDIVETYFKDNHNVKFIELDGTCHHLTTPQAMVALQSRFKEWLEQHT